MPELRRTCDSPCTSEAVRFGLGLAFPLPPKLSSSSAVKVCLWSIEIGIFPTTNCPGASVTGHAEPSLRGGPTRQETAVLVVRYALTEALLVSSSTQYVTPHFMKSEGKQHGPTVKNANTNIVAVMPYQSPRSSSGAATTAANGSLSLMH
mmetsp:Transcript_35329/g.92735  ORF Transcript_35329/g.92735 Transcript_35329/m.92735 type:complete len:150 (-) Transcript_35329:522-971(-)